MSTVDSLADKAKEKLADEIADDKEFARKLKPSLMKKRLRGELPTNEQPGEPPHAPSGPQLGARSKQTSGGPSPFPVIGIALAGGIALAKWIDWRGHAHPRR